MVYEKKYPMTFDEFVNRIWELFIKRGNEKKYWHYFTDIKYIPVHKKEESLLECWYPQFCEDFDKWGKNCFTDKNFIERITKIEYSIKFEQGNYPMTEEEFIKRVKELFLEHSTWPMHHKIDYINRKDVQEDLKDMYETECYNYDREESLGCETNPCFTDYSLGVHVSTLDLMA